MSKRFLFVSGLPRAGSTLLCNILAQNPRCHVTATSGIVDLMLIVRNQWDQLPEFRAAVGKPAIEQAKLRVLRAMLQSYHTDTDKPLVIDKSRSWLAHLEMARAVLPHPPRVLVPVRDLRDVLASFEKLWRSNAATRQIPQEQKFYFEFQTLEGRLKTWTRGDQPVGLAYHRVRDALLRGFAPVMHLVPFERLTRHPRETLASIYAFLDEPPFEHDFAHVEQVTWEDDAAHGITGLHQIRASVEPLAPQWPEILGRAAEPYAAFNAVLADAQRQHAARPQS